ncbi:MAG: glycosyltransferase [Clostridiaceae bacterium]
MQSAIPLVSCVILTYNHFEHLFQTLDSVFMQEYPNIELILLDDGSKDFPAESIKNYIEKRKGPNICGYKVRQQHLNVGTVKNLNTALRLACGEYIMDIGCGDCFYEPNTFSKVVNRLEVTGWDMVSCRRLRCSEEDLSPLGYMPEDRDLQVIEQLNTPERQYRAFVSGKYFNMASGSSVYRTKKHLNMHGYYDEDYRLWEDGPFYTRYTREGNLIHTAYDIISIKYRDGGISTLTNISNAASMVARQLWQDAQKYLEKEVIPYKERFTLIEWQSIMLRVKWSEAKSIFDKLLALAKYPLGVLYILHKKLYFARRHFVR